MGKILAGRLGIAGGVLGSLLVLIIMAGLNLQLEDLESLIAVTTQMSQNPPLRQLLQDATVYSPLYPDLSEQSLNNIIEDPSDMILQVESYSEILSDLDPVPVLTFRAGAFLYFLLQGLFPALIVDHRGPG